MSIVLDYTSPIAPAALKAAGVSRVCRYISLPQSNTAWKRIGLAEYQELLAAGIAVTLNWEYAATDWLGGAAAGRSHGQEAVRQARALGYPTGSEIPGSADFDMTRAQWLTSGAGYAREFAAAIRAGGYRPAVYGPWDVLTWVRDAGYMDAFWQAGMSTSWSGGRNRNPWPGAHLRQRGHKTVGGIDTDYNDILIPNWGVSSGSEGGLMANASEIIVAWSGGFPKTSDGQVVAPVDWRIRDEAWQRSVDAAFAADKVRDTALAAAVQALAVGAGIDGPGLLAQVEAAITAALTPLQQQLAAVQARNLALARALAAAGGALATADD